MPSQFVTGKSSTVSSEAGAGTCGTGYRGQPFLVCWQGAQRDLVRGDIRGVVHLERLARLDCLYAVGPLEELVGEVTILDSTPYLARVADDGSLSIQYGFDHWACFLVYCQVTRWLRVELPERVVNERSLEAILPELAERHGLDPERPFPFLLRGRPESVTIHVLNKTDTAQHSPEQHEKAKARFRLEQREMQAIGFYSRNHRGIFTPADSSIHIHMASADGLASGHVEEMSFPQGLDLFFPTD